MIVSPSPDNGKVSLMGIELALTLIAAAVAFGWPRVGNGFFSRVERAFGKLARRKALSVFVVGLTALLLRLAILPACPIPHPFIPDDFSFLLAADTFAHGRLTNPTPAMWTHFETIHETMYPTYMSMYFPSQGLVLAAGKVLTGQPWFGSLLMSALMCAAICWMLQAWLPPAWALFGGLMAVLHLGLFSYWINTYTGPGLIAACGGALLLGALPRLLKHPRLRYSLWMAVGVVLLATTRPYEGILLCLPVAFMLVRWAWKNRPPAAFVLRLAAVPLALVFAALAWMGYYDYRAFGNPLTLPYTVDRTTYAIAPYFVWQSARPEPAYRHASIRRFYRENELPDVARVHSPIGFVGLSLSKATTAALFFSGIALMPMLLMSGRVLRDRRTRFLVVCLAVLIAGMLLQIFFIPHYVAPFTAAFYALGLQAMRHLRHMKLDGRPVGLGWVRLTVSVCIVMVGVRLFASPLHMTVPEWPASYWTSSWYGPGEYGAERARVEDQLQRLPGKQLVIVRYSEEHYPQDEWVYNAPEVDLSKVVWAREMDAACNLRLLRYYGDRTVWLVQPDRQPPAISLYAIPQQSTIVSATTGSRSSVATQVSR